MAIVYAKPINPKTSADTLLEASTPAFVCLAIATHGARVTAEKD